MNCSNCFNNNNNFMWNQDNNQICYSDYNQNVFQENNQNNNLNIADYIINMMQSLYSLGIPNNFNYNYQYLIDLPFDNQLSILNEIQNTMNYFYSQNFSNNNYQNPNEYNNIPVNNSNLKIRTLTFKTQQITIRHLEFDEDTPMNKAIEKYFDVVGINHLSHQEKSNIVFFYNARSHNYQDTRLIKDIFNGQLNPVITVDDHML